MKFIKFKEKIVNIGLVKEITFYDKSIKCDDIYLGHFKDIGEIHIMFNNFLKGEGKLLDLTEQEEPKKKDNSNQDLYSSNRRNNDNIF